MSQATNWEDSLSLRADFAAAYLQKRFAGSKCKITFSAWLDVVLRASLMHILALCILSIRPIAYFFSIIGHHSNILYAMIGLTTAV